MPNQSRSVPESFVVAQEPVVTGYTEGAAEIDPASPRCFAKKSVDQATKTTRFFIKRATSGPESGSFYNPNSASFGHASMGRQPDGRGAYEFRPVAQEAFELYLRFLMTGNTAYVRCAERI